MAGPEISKMMLSRRWINGVDSEVGGITLRGDRVPLSSLSSMTLSSFTSASKNAHRRRKGSCSSSSMLSWITTVSLYSSWWWNRDVTSVASGLLFTGLGVRSPLLALTLLPLQLRAIPAGTGAGAAAGDLTDIDSLSQSRILLPQHPHRPLGIRKSGEEHCYLGQVFLFQFSDVFPLSLSLSITIMVRVFLPLLLPSKIPRRLWKTRKRRRTRQSWRISIPLTPTSTWPTITKRRTHHQPTRIATTTICRNQLAPPSR